MDTSADTHVAKLLRVVAARQCHEVFFRGAVARTLTICHLLNAASRSVVIHDRDFPDSVYTSRTAEALKTAKRLHPELDIKISVEAKQPFFNDWFSSLFSVKSKLTIGKSALPFVLVDDSLVAMEREDGSWMVTSVNENAVKEVRLRASRLTDSPSCVQ